jgi:hypothetical protein
MRNRVLMLSSLILAVAGCTDEAVPTGPELTDIRPSLLAMGDYSIKDLGTLPEGTTSGAREINVHGVIVGGADSAGSSRALRWSESDGMRNLGTLKGFPNSAVNGINAAGTIVGRRTAWRSRARSFG